MIQFLPGRPYCAAYVNLPGGQKGIIPEGETFDIGEERLYSAPSIEEMRHMLIGGLQKLKAIVEEEKLKGASA